MYSSISELPTEVRNSLDAYSCKRWMDTYNKSIPEDPTDKDVLNARYKAWDFVKEDPSSFSFCAFATVETKDRQNEVITVKSVRDNIDDFMIRGGTGITDHSDYVTHVIWHWEDAEVNGKPALKVWGNIYGGSPVYDKARRDFVEGKNSLSIAGEAELGKYECTEEGCYIRRDVQNGCLMEISLCTVPANPMSTLIWYNKDAKLTKSIPDDTIVLSVERYEIHRDAQFCPVQATKKALIDAGIEAHAKTYGVEIDAKDINAVRKSHTLGYISNGDKVIVQSKSRMLEKARGNCMKKGYINSDGMVLNAMPMSVFKSLKSRRMLEPVKGGYCFRKGTDDLSEAEYEESLRMIMSSYHSDLIDWVTDGKTLHIADMLHSRTWHVKYYKDLGDVNDDEFKRLMSHTGEIYQIGYESY